LQSPHQASRIHHHRAIRVPKAGPIRRRIELTAYRCLIEEFKLGTVGPCDVTHLDEVVGLPRCGGDAKLAGSFDAGVDLE
jgi:hypothetical protein